MAILIGQRFDLSSARAEAPAQLPNCHEAGTSDTFLLAGAKPLGSPSAMDIRDFILELAEANDERSLDKLVKYVSKQNFPAKLWINVLHLLSDNPFRLGQVLAVIQYYSPYTYRMVSRAERGFMKALANMAADIEFDGNTPLNLKRLGYISNGELLARFRFYLLGYIAAAYDDKKPVGNDGYKKFSEELKDDLAKLTNGVALWEMLSVSIKSLDIRLDYPPEVRASLSLTPQIIWDSKEEAKAYRALRSTDTDVFCEMWLKKRLDQKNGR